MLHHFFVRPSVLACCMMVVLSGGGMVAFADVVVGEPYAHLGEITVTATGNPTKLQNTLAQTTVITEQQLARYQGQNVLDVLKSQAGFSHYASGGTDKASNFYVRGFDSGSTLVLIDGVRYGSVTTGSPALGALNVNDVGRIEIVYGASGSSIYGANAMGAVIQIFTKRAKKAGLSLEANAGIGSHRHNAYGGNIAYANDTSKLSLSVQRAKSDGINAIDTPYNSTQRDNDGFVKNSILASASHRLGAIETGANVLLNQGVVEYDSPSSKATEPVIYAKQKNGATSFYALYRYGNENSGNHVRLQHGLSIDQSTNFAGANNTGIFNSKQQQTNLNIAHALPLGKLLAGVDHLQQNVQSTTAYDKTARHNTGMYLGYQASHGNLDGQAFVRYDKNSWYGDNANYNAGLSYRLYPSLRLGANYATGFKAPTFNQLYYPRGGNPNLRPEKSQNHEIFVEFLGNQHKTRLMGYQSDVSDLIAGWPAQNINRAKVQGASLLSDWSIANDYVAGIHYDYQKAQDITNSSASYALPVRPVHKGMVYVGYIKDGIDLRAEYQRVGSYYMATNHGDKVAGYGLLNLSASYELAPNITLVQRVNNLLNAKYVTNESFGTRYNEDGTNFYTAINFKY